MSMYKNTAPTSRPVAKPAAKVTPKTVQKKADQAVGKIVKPTVGTKTPVYTGQQARKLQEQKNKPKTKSSMGYKGATRV